MDPVRRSFLNMVGLVAAYFLLPRSKQSSENLPRTPQEVNKLYPNANIPLDCHIDAYSVGFTRKGESAWIHY